MKIPQIDTKNDKKQKNPISDVFNQFLSNFR